MVADEASNQDVDSDVGGMPDEEAEHEKQPTCQQDEEEDQGRGGNREDEQESHNVLEGNQKDKDEGEGDREEYIATKEAFLLPINKDSICWESILAVVKGDDLLTAKLGNVKGDEEAKGIFIDYVWGAATEIRGEIVYKARMAVPLAYGLPGQLKGEELGDVLKWLIEEGKMLHPNINPR
ncbi:hypothetical protein PAXRUDRAFT_28862 [Paxillus rubicundulus Ve08.2h10]|uniref:Unplaced genomic scaffold scaffold_2304, whole genome shotgun sequence n=1 Tax=Paxillus rubicundulus Ve08.2h10 TaxID=930991 RepID=A0A0D0DGQ7_9AGAM|nr:hypothetical protein PAXRUDRAFT_28862 [Paxillus rubicundulus Ve08.2h10]